MSRNHVRYLARTVFVKNNDIDTAARTLDRVLREDKYLENVRRRKFNEKPFITRQRISYERCKRIYSTDMQKKVNFVMRKNRVDPWPR